MKIYTTYFARVPMLPEDIVPIAITDGQPIGSNLKELKEVVPSISIYRDYKENQDIEHYVYRYKREILIKIDVHRFVEKLEAISGGKDVALVSYERSGVFSYRYVVAAWLRKNGYDAKEIDL